MNRCTDHLGFTGSVCPDCGLAVDHYGNTEEQFENCSFPDCGCDGARVCMAGEASDRAETECVEGMWSGRTVEQRRAGLALVASVAAEAGAKQ